MSQIETIRHLASTGDSQSEIARKMNLSRPTVRKYLRMDDFSPSPPSRSSRASILDPFKPRIDAIMESDRREWRKQRHSAKRIFERLRDEYGYTGGYSTVQTYVRDKKKGIRSGDGYLDLVWEPGTAQCDFGEADFFELGVKRREDFFVMAFPFSGMPFTQVFGGTTSECVCQGLKDIFENIGGVPPIIVFDNATGIGRRIADGVRESDLFRRFRLHYGFEARFCNPNSGHEKGCVERKVAWTRSNLFVPIPSFDSILEYNDHLFERAGSYAHTRHHRIDSTWGELFEQDRGALVALPAKPFDVVRYELYRTDGYGEVTVDGCHVYPTSPTLCACDITVGFRAHTLVFVDRKGVLVAEHRREFGSRKTVARDPAASLHVLSRKPGAWMNSSVRASLPERTVEWLDSQPKDVRSSMLRALDEASSTGGFDTAVSSIEGLVSSGRPFSTSDVRVLSLRTATFGAGVKPDPGPDLAVYDRCLLRKEM